MSKSVPRRNIFNLKKTGKEFSSSKEIFKLSVYLRFLDIFPVFDEFLPFFLLFVNSNILHTFSCRTWKNCWRFLPFETIFTQLHVENWQFFGTSHRFQNAMKFFLMFAWGNRDKISFFCFGWGKIWNFWAKYLPLKWL